MDDAIAHGVDILTIGQYLRPSKDSLPVVEYVDDETYAYYKEEGTRRGFKMVAAGTHVRSSYLADMVFDEAAQGEAHPALGFSKSAKAP
jgi:lipoic acid synthetase